MLTGVLEDGLHGHGVAVVTRSRRDAEEPILGIDGSQIPVVIEPKPRDVIANTSDVVPGETGAQHGQVGLPAG